MGVVNQQFTTIDLYNTESLWNNLLIYSQSIGWPFSTETRLNEHRSKSYTQATNSAT